MLDELLTKNRSYRRFQEHVAIERSTLEDFVALTRLAPSAANLQPLKYILCCDANTNARVFPLLAWAGYLTDWPGPADGERPSAYIVILGDRQIAASFDCDHGIAAQTILLAAAERGLGGCIIGSVQREALRGVLAIPAHHEILLVLALGTPAETVVLETTRPDGDIRYWRDEQGTHHVPKRPLHELIVG
jgi:nitroreductase